MNQQQKQILQKISLNFFGEEITIPLPKDLSSLRSEISSKFLFSPSDTAEIIISYIKNLQKQIISTEEDFLVFIKSKILKIDLDINKESKIYMKSLISIKQQAIKEKTELNSLLKKNDDLKEKIAKEKAEEQSKLKAIEKRLNAIKKQKIKTVKGIKNVITPLKNQENKNVNEIVELEKKLGLPITTKEEVINKEKKESKNTENFEEDNKKLDLLLRKNNLIIHEQENKFSLQKKKMDSFDKQIKDLSKEKMLIIKSTQLTIKRLTSEQEVVIKNIIEMQKKLGLPVTVKLAPKKFGFFIPKREKEAKEVKEKKEIIKKEAVNTIKDQVVVQEKQNAKEIENKVEKIMEKVCDKLNGYVRKEIAKENIKLQKMRLKASWAGIDENQDKDVKKLFTDINETNSELFLELSGLTSFIKERTKELTQSIIKKKKENNQKLCQIINKIKERKEQIAQLNEVNENCLLIHNDIKCDGCGSLPITGQRYKCQVCSNVDYCKQCYEILYPKHGHKFKIIELDNGKEKDSIKEIEEGNDVKKKEKEEKNVHLGVFCDGCGQCPIKGTRYKCTFCENFDLCEKCEEKVGEKHGHPMLKLIISKMAPLRIKCELVNELENKGIGDNEGNINDVKNSETNKKE